MLQPTPSGPQGEQAQEEARDLPRVNAPAQPALDPAWRAGRKLSEARRQLGLSLDDVAERIRVRREFLQALEDMNIKLLPGKAYALAFLRSYARELGIDEKAIVDQFQDESALSREDAHKQMRDPSSRPGRERPWMVAAVLLVVATAFLGWRVLTRDDAPAGPVADTPTVAQAPSVSGGAVDISAPTRVVEIKAIADAWLETRGPDGTVFLSRTLHQGEVYRPDPSPGWTLHARDGGAFELYVNGVPAGLLGVAGAPVLGRSIDEIEPPN